MPTCGFAALLSKFAARALFLLCLGLAPLAPAHAQSAEQGVLNLVVPYGPGGPTDLTARILAVQLQRILRQTVIVVNKPGAGSALGARYVASAAPDGQTLLVGNVSTFSIVPATMANAGYDAVKSFAAIAKLADFSAVMITPVDFPPANLADFVVYAKAHPKSVFFASAGVGNSAHLNGELLKAKADIDVIHVPYKGGADMVAAVRSGQVQFGIADVSGALGLIREGQVKALAVTGAKRLPLLPAVPTMVELGYPDVVFSNWTALAAPAGTDRAIVKKLEAAVNEAIQSPEFQNFVQKSGGEASPGSSAQLAQLIAAEHEKWGAVAKAAGVSLN